MSRDHRRDQLRTSLSTASHDTITVAGHDLTSELMGEVSLSDMAFLTVQGRLPSDDESRMLDAVLTSLCDHGVTPSAITARLTYTGAPESIQGAMAAGLLGAGDFFLGVVEGTARMLHDALGDADGTDEQTLRALAQETVAEIQAHGGLVPGLGHRFHKHADPRTGRLYELADVCGLLGPHLRLLRHIGRVANASYGKDLPINGAGTAGAALADLGFDPTIVRGFAVMSRAAGLVGQLWEEMRTPLGRGLLDLIHHEVAYEPPHEGGNEG